MAFLEEENQKLKDQLKAMMKEMRELKEENCELKSQLTKNPELNKNRVANNAEDTFITKGSEDPEIVCENW